MPYFSGPNGIREVADPGERFTQAFRESRLAKLYGDYFKTGNADLGQLARFDPEGAAKIKAEQERRGLAALLGNIYEAPDDQRQGLIAEAFRKDPTLGMNAAKMFDPRFVNATNGLPSELQTFQAMTKGMSEDDILKARRVALGLDPRQSSAAIGYQKITGADGRERLVAVDPRQVGAVDMSSGQAFGSGVGAGGQSAPSGGDMQKDIALANELAKAGFDPDKIDAWLTERGQRANALGALPAGGAQFVGRTPEQQAALTEQAKADVQYGNMGRVGQMEATNAGLKAEAEAAAKARTEQSLKVAIRARDDREQLSLLSDAAGLLKTATSGGAEEAWKGANRYFGRTTEGAKADAQLNVIAGKLTGKVPRFEGPQSNTDVDMYKQMAGDLANPNKTRGERIAAAHGMINLIIKYQNYTKQQNNQAPATGGFRILPD